METVLCPYPGLRPFDEKESIFFKGREKNIDDIIGQLEQNRFVMITGASGDGKSSIVYAGVIPNIKAGFIKATYNAWRFSIIKPEDRPLFNLSKSLAEIFKLPVNTVYEDLSFGFSSIVELYIRSEFYTNNESQDWKDLSLDEKKLKRSKAANLFILVDQFEEFFTNTENFFKNEPTLEAETVLNLLVETIRIANEEKLPIYIVFTMRSDFIGNSPAFRGLPELVGFSHFFIPRLNREEIEKIILEPALLNGDSISDQLVNYLTSAAADGTDQLPTIQHALNRIWNIARENKEEMGLIHLAMAGGIDPVELSESDRKRFSVFFEKNPQYKKAHFKNPSLQNVINAHADELMEDTVTEFKKNNKSDIPEETLFFALKRSFQTLTKIDEGRSVRHRSSVNDLIGNINKNDIGLGELDSLLRKYREPGNTLLNPFVSQQEKLNSDSVIDITHEALIRNWEKLRMWSEEDAQNLNDFVDFNKQLLRWQESNKSDSFLLPLGPLQQFETWYENSFINEHWLVKYDESIDPVEQKFNNAKSKINNITVYIKESRQYLNSIEKAKKRKNKVLVSISILIMLVLSGLTIWAFNQKNFAASQQELAEQKRIESENSKSQALQSKDEAEKAKLKAQENEQHALRAKLETEKFAKDVIAQKIIAEQATVLAQTKSAYANQQAERANAEMTNAVTQKTIAESAKVKALNSEFKTKTLSSKALSQQIAYMAADKHEEDQLSALFAMHALDLHKEVNGDIFDPVVYNGLIQANYYLNGKDCFNFSKRASVEQSVIFEANNKLFSLGTDGKLYEWDRQKKEGNINVSESKIQKNGLVENLFLEQKAKTLFTETKTGLVFGYALSEGEISPIGQFEGLGGALRGGMIVNDGGKCLLVSKAGLISIYNKGNKNPEKVIELKEEVVSFSALNKSECLIGTTKGNIYQIASTGEKKLLYFNDKQKQIPYSIETDKSGKIVYAGFSDGKIIKFTLQDNVLVIKNEYKVSRSIIKKLSFNEKSSVLTGISSDNKIWMIDFDHAAGKPVNLMFGTHARTVYADNDGNVYVALSDLTFKQFHSNANTMYSELCPQINRDLTPEEWKKYFGDEVEFKPLNCKK